MSYRKRHVAEKMDKQGDRNTKNDKGKRAKGEETRLQKRKEEGWKVYKGGILKRNEGTK